MGIRVLEGIEGGDANGRTVLYQSTAERAYPWIFFTAEAAEAFLEHINEKHPRFGHLSTDEQEAIHEAWEKEHRCSRCNSYSPDGQLHCASCAEQVHSHHRRGT